MKNTPSFTGVALNFAKSFGTLLLNLCLRISYTASLSDAQNYRFLTMKKKKKKDGEGELSALGEKKKKKKRKEQSCMRPPSQAASPVCEHTTSSL